MVIQKGGRDFKRSAGEILKAARRERRLTISDVATELRIPPLHIGALEEGDLSVFAAQVYARGAYQKYAEYLGVDRKDSYNSFLRSLAGSSETKPLKVPVPYKWLSRVLTPYGVIGGSIILAVLMVSSYLGWQIFSFVRLPELELLEPISGIVEGSEVNVRGTIEEGATLTVNGDTVLPNVNGEFEYLLPLRSGINVLQIEAVGVAGQTRVITHDLSTFDSG